MLDGLVSALEFISFVEGWVCDADEEVQDVFDPRIQAARAAIKASMAPRDSLQSFGHEQIKQFAKTFNESEVRP